MEDQIWTLDGVAQDEQSITKEWQLVGQNLIEGVIAREVINVQRSFGFLTEIYRGDWGLDDFGVDQVFQSVLEPGAVSAWHAHALTTDRIFINWGRMRIVLYDAREGSPTQGQLNHFVFGVTRPAMLVIPPRVWHGVQAVAKSGPSALLNVVDHAYHYEQPDHYRLPEDTDQIPYTFPAM